MVERRHVDAIRARLRQLPAGRLMGLMVTVGAKVLCDACEATVDAGQYLYTIVLSSGAVLRFHAACFNIWNDERARLDLVAE